MSDPEREFWDGWGDAPGWLLRALAWALLVCTVLRCLALTAVLYALWRVLRFLGWLP